MDRPADTELLEQSGSERDETPWGENSLFTHFANMCGHIGIHPMALPNITSYFPILKAVSNFAVSK